MSTVRVLVKRAPEAEDLPLPSYATDGAAGLDLCAAIPEDEPLVLAPGARAVVSTGIMLELPEGYEAQVRPRSGLAARHGLGMVNSPGTIDSDYRGVVKVVLINWGSESVSIRRGDRVAQLVVSPVTRVELCDAAELGPTERGANGFGSTGS